MEVIDWFEYEQNSTPWISGVSPNVIAKFGKNELVAMESLLKIAAALNVDVSEIISSDVIDAEDVK